MVPAKVERSHRIDANEFCSSDGVVIDESGLAERPQQWEDFCRFDRPDGGPGGRPPYE